MPEGGLEQEDSWEIRLGKKDGLDDNNEQAFPIVIVC